jgi:hypothetical protein
MNVEALRARLAPELVDWFACEIDKGDAPELHLVGLQPGDLERCFAAIVERAPEWNDRTFHIDDEGVDVTVREKPDVAQLVAQGRASHACLGAEGIAVDGVELPLLEMFLFVDELQFFWWPDASWTPERVAAFFALVRRLLALAPAAYLRPDPRYPATSRRTLGELIGRVLGDPSRLDYAGRLVITASERSRFISDD